MDEKTLNKIIAYAYDDLGFFDGLKMKRFVESNEEARRVYYEYRSVYQSVKNIRREDLPEHILQDVNRKINLKEKNERSFFADLYTLFISKPALGVASVVVVLAILLSTLVIERPTAYNGYTKAEVEAADRQVKRTLAIIGEVFDQTEKTLEKEVLASKVGRPLKEGINLVNNLFNEENENETSN